MSLTMRMMACYWAHQTRAGCSNDGRKAPYYYLLILYLFTKDRVLPTHSRKGMRVCACVREFEWICDKPECSFYGLSARAEKKKATQTCTIGGRSIITEEQSARVVSFQIRASYLTYTYKASVHIRGHYTKSCETHTKATGHGVKHRKIQ